MSEAVYVIGQIKVHDHQQYISSYALPTSRLIERYGGEILVASPQAQLAEGSWFGNWTIVFRFPDRHRVLAFYQSHDYAELKRLRIDVLTDACNLVVVPEFDQSALMT